MAHAEKTLTFFPRTFRAIAVAATRKAGVVKSPRDTK